MADDPPSALRCSFCAKAQGDVQKLVCGHNGVAICDECVETCRKIMREDDGPSTEDDYVAFSWSEKIEDQP